MIIGKCEICKFGQTEYCTNPNRDNDCFEVYSGITEIEKKIRADERAKALEELQNRIDCEYYDGGYGITMMLR